MGRPRQFDQEHVLDAAMRVFWEMGYEAAALPDLLAAMKLTRGSFYKAFKSKSAVYLLSLKRYNGTVIGPVIESLNTSGSEGTIAIQTLFKRLAAIVRSKDGARGCFLCKAAIDRAPHDLAVAREVRRTFSALETAFANALAHDDESQHALIKQKAGQLSGSYLAIQLLRSAGNCVSMVDAIVAETLQNLPNSRHL